MEILYITTISLGALTVVLAVLCYLLNRRYLSYKKMVMIGMYGGKSAVIQTMADLQGYPVVDLPIVKGTKLT